MPEYTFQTVPEGQVIVVQARKVARARRQALGLAGFQPNEDGRISFVKARQLPRSVDSLLRHDDRDLMSRRPRKLW
ncbi:MAG: hypothetical protein HY397_02250 [Candidatus Doudnabacteria bacterium]|nr:hypothetical protein [Candidatus Doudnabacteria bacterium]